MSRRIEAKASVTIAEEERQLRQSMGGKLLFTSYRGHSCSLLIQNDRLVEAFFFQNTPSRLGAIYIGKVRNVVKNINACFVEIAKGEICFLSMRDAENAWLLNRSRDGRILEGDELIVQVTRDAHKTKNASVTAQISLSNDYFALSMGSEKVGYSTRLSSKKKLAAKRLLTEMMILNPETGCLIQDYGAMVSIDFAEKMKARGIRLDTLEHPPISLIVRTRVEEAESAEELLGHFYELSAQYIELLHTAAHRSCFSCLREAAASYEPIVQQFIRYRDQCAQEMGSDSENSKFMDSVDDTDSSKSVNGMHTSKLMNGINGSKRADGGNWPGALWEIITDQKSMYEELCRYCAEHEYDIELRLYQDRLLSLSALYSVNSRMENALGSRVWLKSGAYLVIEPTEALTVIDVNSGKYEAGKSAGESYRKINFEAAAEIALQLRLRNLSGIIVVDFINMQSARDNADLLVYLRALAKKDRIKTTVVDMTPLGLVEITRKKTNKPLREQLADFGS